MLRQTVAAEKFEILKKQEKKNVALAEAEIEASDNYRLMREQESKVKRIEEFIRISKKNADSNF